jgi:hypothetical protein
MGLSGGEGKFSGLNIGDSVVSQVVEILLLIVLLEALFGRQISWWKVTFFLSFFSFGSYWLIVAWCIVLLLHPLPSVLLGLFVLLSFSFSASWLHHKSWGGDAI